jgi:hypothetical protein
MGGVAPAGIIAGLADAVRTSGVATNEFYT